jgi:hypothetical protein
MSTATAIEANYDEAGTCAYCGWNSAYMHSHAMSAAWEGCKYMDSRYDITTEDGEVRCVEQAWYAAHLEKKIAALHDKEMPWQGLLERIHSDDELCYLDGWSNKPPKELRESLGQMGQYMAHIVEGAYYDLVRDAAGDPPDGGRCTEHIAEEAALAKQLTAASLSPPSPDTAAASSPPVTDS